MSAHSLPYTKHNSKENSKLTWPHTVPLSVPADIIQKKIASLAASATTRTRSTAGIIQKKIARSGETSG